MNAPGLVFGKYEIQHRLAIGGMGEVFYAVQRGVPGFERPVILKSLLPDLAQQPGFIDQFLDEARVAATLNHPNVVSIFEVGLWNGTYFIAMEYIRGRNLSQLLHRCVEQQVPVPPLVAARIIADAALGLQHAHVAVNANGEPLHIVHRDISPQNIMLREDGVTKVVDFGIARASNRATRTATGTIKGKLAYMAPEQVQGGALSSAVDQYALGVCFWELLTQKRLFKAQTDLDVLKAVIANAVPPPSSERDGIDPLLDAVVLRMVAAEPGARFASCAEVAAVLADYLASRSPPGGVQPGSFMRRLGTDDLVVQRTATPSGPNFVISLEPPVLTGKLVAAPPPPPPSPPRRAAPLVAAVGLGLALAAAGAWWATRPAPVAPAVLVAPVVAPAVAPVVVPVVVPVVTPVVTPVTAALAHLAVTSVPAGATARVDGRPVGTTPLELDVTAGVVHYLSLDKPGFRATEQEVPATDGGVRVEATVKLVALAQRPAAPPVVAAPSANTEPGFLSLETVPWSKVAIDGEPAGSTPLFKKKLAAGRHTLLLVNEGASLRVTKSVDIEPGKTLKVTLQLP